MLKKALPIIIGLWTAVLFPSQAQNFLKKFRTVNSFAKLGNLMVFAADDGVNGLELWKTDGTPGGTVMIKDIAPGAASSNIAGCYLFNGKVYFSANDGLHGTELWRTDGTANGTEMFKDINLQTSMYDSSMPGNFTEVNGSLFFLASAGGAYRGLWKTDGTAAGTVKLVDDNSFGLSQLTVVANKLYFTTDGNRALWTSNGTPSGTKQLIIDDNYTVDELRAVNNDLVFITNTSYRQSIRLYKLDALTNNAVLLKSYSAVTYGSLDIGNITQVGSGFYFSIRTVDASDQGIDALWKSDGTPGGTTSVKTFSWRRYISNSYMQNFVSFNNKLYFAGTSNYTLWTSDGTDAGTVKLSDVVLAQSRVPVISNQKMFFASGGLWSFNGSTAQKELEQPANPDLLYDVNGKLYFVSSTSSGAELWNNDAQPQILVSRSFQTLINGAALNLTSKVDSAAISTVSIKNIGNKELTLSEITVTGAPFYVNGKTPRSVLPGKQISFNLIYSPVKEETLTGGTLQIKSDNCTGGSFVTNLTGTASGTATNRTATPVDGLFKTIVFQDTLSAFTLSNISVNEKQPVGTTVGVLAMINTSAPFAYTLVAGVGDNDNGSFEIQNGQIKTRKVFQFSEKSTYTVRVKATQDANSFEKSFAITIADLQESMTAESCAKVMMNLNYSLNDAAYINSRIVAVGTGGKIIASDNNGQDWQTVPTGIGADLRHVTAIDDQVAYAMGSNVLLKTENGGKSWFPVALPDATYPYLGGMYFYSANIGYIFGENKLYKTIDGGKNWQKLTAGNSFSNVPNAAWFISENVGFICGSSQSLMRTTDGGKTWENIALASLGFNTNLVKIVFTNSKTGYITSSVGDVLQTVDGGNTWARISTVSTDYVNRILFTTEQEGYILCGFNSSLLYKTTDAGRTWTRENISSFGAFTGLAVNKSKDKLCLVGHGVGFGYTSRHGNCIYVKNGSGAWETKSDLNNGNFYKLLFTDENSAFMFGTSSFKTTDAGLTWKAMILPSDSYNTVRNASFVDKNTGFASNLNDIYKTVNAGVTWDKITTDRSSTIALSHFITADVGFYSTGAGQLYKTTNGGQSWKQLALNTTMGGLRYMQFFDQQNGVLLVLGGKLYKTTDAGETWLPVEISGGYFFLTAYFINAQVGFVGGTNGTLLRTQDGGTTWTLINIGYTSLSMASIAFVDDSHGYAVTNYSGSGSSEIYETFDAGRSWQKNYTTSDGLFSMAVVNKKAYLTGDYGNVFQLGVSAQLANTGYITGDAKVVAGVKYIYTVPAVSGTYFNWTTAGASSVEYQNNSIIVSWKDGGRKTLQASPYNSCSNGESRTQEIDVQTIAEPVVSGPNFVYSQSANVEYTVSSGSGSNAWATTGTFSSAPENTKVKVNWGNAGEGKVTVTVSNAELGIKKSATLNVTIKELDKLPADNFNVAVTSLSCKGSNNGTIKVTAKQSFNYTAVITGANNYSKTIQFSNELNVTDMAVGAYNICINIAGNANPRCYTVNIAEPKDLAVYSMVDQASQTLKLNLSGGENYYIDLNGKQYQTNLSQYEVELANGANNLKISTDKACQGVFEKRINFNSIVLYPNPVVNILNIDLAGNVAKSASVEVRNLSGRILLSKRYAADMQSVLTMDLGSLENGVYLLRLTLNTSEYMFKVIKK